MEQEDSFIVNQAFQVSLPQELWVMKSVDEWDSGIKRRIQPSSSLSVVFRCCRNSAASHLYSLLLCTFLLLQRSLKKILFFVEVKDFLHGVLVTVFVRY